MPVSSKVIEFTKERVDKSPDQPGVYALLVGNRVIYYGSSEVSIRGRLQDHLSGAEGPCTAEATHYKREVCSNPRQRESQLIKAFEDSYGRLPRCNSVRP